MIKQDSRVYLTHPSHSRIRLKHDYDAVVVVVSWICLDIYNILLLSLVSSGRNNKKSARFIIVLLLIWFIWMLVNKYRSTLIPISINITNI
jgi:Kef-type K+ transport system membrane component KefB